jgi:hypothetical protein
MMAVRWSSLHGLSLLTVWLAMPAVYAQHNQKGDQFVITLGFDPGLTELTGRH